MGVSGPANLNKAEPDVTFVIPTRNAERHLAKSCSRLGPVLKELGLSCEIVLVDDGSRDSTPVLLKCMGDTHPQVRAILLDEHKGKGRAVVAGIRGARGRILFFADDDLEFDLSAVQVLIQGVVAGADVVNGQRIGGRRTFLRRAAASLLLPLFRHCNPWEVSDPTSPVKCAEKALFDSLENYPWFGAFPHEFAIVMARRGIQVPVRVQTERTTSSRFSLWALVREFLGLTYALVRLSLSKKREGRGTR